MTDRGTFAMTDAGPLVPLLREELKLQARHCRLLEAQQSALMACDRPRFCALHTEYVRLLEQLEAQAQARQAAMQDGDGNAVTLAALLETLPARQQTTLTGLRDALRRTLERAQGLCRSNQHFIQNELDYFTFSLDLFVEAGRRADTCYGGRSWGRRKLLDRRA